ncbi:MAG: hypothetical protein R3322_20085 [Kiloniellales bacterium]|jgi:hypothetical protein|nr:hypothetical protein [Kiloniellales bacterium]
MTFSQRRQYIARVRHFQRGEALYEQAWNAAVAVVFIGRLPFGLDA